VAQEATALIWPRCNIQAPDSACLFRRSREVRSFPGYLTTSTGTSACCRAWSANPAGPGPIR